jgi:hypothetical protein
VPDDDALAETVEGTEPPPSSPRRERSDASPFDPPAPTKRFVEAAELGRGGMGRVFEAIDTALDRQVAIKQSLADDPQLIARFEREVKITAKLQHPAIVPVLDAGRDAQGRPYYVMRKIEGKPLADAIASASTLAARMALVPNVLAAVDAAAYAHARGVIHRDIKPWNVLVGPFGETLLIDWGLARELADDQVEHSLGGLNPGSDDLTRAGSAYGTPGFMAPEQARGEPLDRRADVFGLGATLFHVLAGRKPLAQATPTEAIDLAASNELTARLPAEVPAELATIVAKAMSPEAANRYPDAGALAEDLRRFTTGQLVAAHHYTARDLIGRWIKRHRLAIAIAMIALVVLAVGAVISVQRVMASADEADQHARRAEDAAQRVAERADELILEHAQSMLHRDPTRSVALLRELQTKGTALWARASAIFDSAIVRGVARGRHVHRGAVSTRVAASPEGDRVVSVGSDGAVFIHDPALLGEPRRIATVENATNVDWVTHDQLLVSSFRGITMLVSLDGRVTQVASQARQLVPSADGRGFLVDRSKNLREIDLGRGVTFEPVSGVDLAYRIRGALVYAKGDAAIYHPDGGQPMTLAADTPTMMTHSADGLRLAVAFKHETIEWRLESGAPVESGRWKVRGIALVYAEHSLISQDPNQTVWLFPGQPPRLATGPFATMNARTRSSRCAYVATFDGGLWRACRGTVMQMSGRTENLSSLTIAGGRLVGATMTGRLFSWDTTSEPRRFELPQGLHPITFAGGRVYSQFANVKTLDVNTLESSDLGIGTLACRGSRYGVFLSLAEPEGAFVLELASARMQRFGPSTLVVGCSRDDRVALYNGKQIEIRALARPDVIEAKLDAPFAIGSIDLEGDWLLVAGKTEFARIDLRTRAVSRVELAERELATIDARGRVALMAHRDVMLWQPDGTLVTLPLANTNSATVLPGVGIAFSTRDRSVVVLADDGTTRTFHQGTSFTPSIAAGAPIVVMPGQDHDLVVIDLRDGQTRLIPGDVLFALISFDGKQVLGWTGTSALLWDVPQARTRDELLTAIDATTNARIDPSTTRVVFERNPF